ncbi:NDR1/HIN1-like protein 1 [Diospyros lotus]|uniref:NDR1/HIN1-like protein 1 n=1 Tax=Diospyros lotus TaxID=55363 RepID=UPI002253A7B1|nr:NDR1/HIN1-like protein 1 [Diospyros lotus]
MSEKCSHHRGKWRKRLRPICAGLLIFNFILLVVILIIWAILQPKKPRFVLQDATVYAFNVSGGTFLTSNFQVTIASRNPNDKIGIYYDRLDVYATYHSQQITLYTRIPSVYQGHKDVNVWSPFVSGNNVPVAPYNGMALGQDQADGQVMITIKMDGRVRFKVNTFVSGRYHLYVKCPAIITFGSRSTGVVMGNAVKYQLYSRCSVTV